MVLNTIVAESLDYIATELEKATGGDAGKLNAAVQKVLQEIATRAQGDHLQRQQLRGRVARGGREARPAEPAEHGRRRCRRWSSRRAIALFEKYGVLSEREVHSRYDIYMERYCKDINSEALCALSMAKTMILPAAYRYQGELAGDRPRRSRRSARTRTWARWKR